MFGNIDINNLLSGLIGAVIGGVISLGGVWWAEKRNCAAALLAEAKIESGLLQALHDELEAIFERLEQNLGPHITALPEGSPLLVVFPIINEYFTVYNANAFLIGRIKNNSLRKALVRIYVSGKALVDSFRLNNAMVDRYQQLHFLVLESKNPTHVQEKEALVYQMVQYAALLKKGYFDIKLNYAAVMKLIDKK
jgi:hypothetical protein